MGKRLLYCFQIGLLIPLAACVETGGDAGTDFDFTAMIANVADNIIVPQYRSVEAATAELAGASGAIQGYCDAIGTANEAAARTQAQAAWRQVMAEWQQAELWILGPAANNNNSLRNRINYFGGNQRLSTCGADQAVVLAQDPGFNIQTRSLNHRGLIVLEYLLFNDDLTHTCPSQIVETQDWNSRSETEREQLRCNYAQLAADDMQQAVASLISAWLPEQGNYRFEFLNPQNISNSIGDLSDALFYLDTDVKDQKLGVPLGIHAGCSSINCADRVESRYSGASLQNIQNNLRGFRQIFTGGEGPGFDDLIAERGFASFNQTFLEHIDQAIALIDTIPDSLYEQSLAIATVQDETACTNATANPDTPGSYLACNLHGQIKRITDELKTDFITIVNVDLPERAQSDND